MSVRTVRGTSHAIHGSRTKPAGESARHFMPLRIFCWRRARLKSFSFLLQRCADARERERVLAVDVVRAALQAHRDAAVLRAAVDLADDARSRCS